MGFLSGLGKFVVVAGAAAAQISLIDKTINDCRSLQPQEVVSGFAHSVARMDDENWELWQTRLSHHVRQQDSTAELLYKIGNYTRIELGRSKQLIALPIGDAIYLAGDRFNDMNFFEQLCFLRVLELYAEHDLRADAVYRKLVQAIQA